MAAPVEGKRLSVVMGFSSMGLVGVVSKTKGKFGRRPRQLARLLCEMAGCRSIDHALHDALPDRRDAEEAVGEIGVPLPLADILEPHPPEIGRAVLLDAG